MTFKEVFEWISQGEISSEKISFLEKIKRATTKTLEEKWNLSKKQSHFSEELINIKKISPSEKEIITILDSCITNDIENIDIDYIEYNYEENSEYENYLKKYRENYLSLLQWIKDKLLKNSKIIDSYGAEILKHLEAIQKKRELTLWQINILAEFILKTYGEKYNQISQDTFIEWGIGNVNNDILDFIVKN